MDDKLEAVKRQKTTAERKKMLRFYFQAEQGKVLCVSRACAFTALPPSLLPHRHST